MSTTTSECTGTSILSADPLTPGVSNFVINGCNGVTGGTALVTNNGIVSIAYERVGKATQLPEPSTLAIFSLALIDLGSRRFKTQS